MEPGKRFTNMALACKGISLRVKASLAGLKSSVLVSPGTFRTATVILEARAGLWVNHSALAHESMTSFAYGLVFERVSMSLNEPYTKTVYFSASQAAFATASSEEFSASTKG